MTRLTAAHARGPLAAAALGAAAWLTATVAAAAVTLPDPRLGYRSSFPPAQPADPAPQRWSDSNEGVRLLGGHAGHLRGGAASPRPGQSAGPHTPRPPSAPAAGHGPGHAPHGDPK